MELKDILKDIDETTAEDLPTLDEILEDPVMAGIKFHIATENIPPDEEELNRKRELISKVDPDFLKEVIEKYLTESEDLKVQKSYTDPMLLLLENFPDVKLTQMKPFSEKSIERFYQPECSTDCIHVKTGKVTPVGYEIRTPVSFLRIEGCNGAVKRCKKKFVQVAYKGIKPGKISLMATGEDSLAPCEDNNPIHEDVFWTAWDILRGKAELNDFLEHFRNIMFFGIENRISTEKLSNVKIPERGELISQVFDEEKIPGIFMYPVELGAGCGLHIRMGNTVRKNISLAYFSRYQPECLKYNYYLSLVRYRKRSRENYFCMADNCHCGPICYICDLSGEEQKYDDDFDPEASIKVRLSGMDIIFSFNNIRKLRLKYNFKDDKEVIRIIMKVLSLLV